MPCIEAAPLTDCWFCSGPAGLGLVLVEFQYEYPGRDGATVSIKPNERYVLLAKTNDHWTRTRTTAGPCSSSCPCGVPVPLPAPLPVPLPAPLPAPLPVPVPKPLEDPRNQPGDEVTIRLRPDASSRKTENRMSTFGGVPLDFMDPTPAQRPPQAHVDTGTTNMADEAASKKHFLEENRDKTRVPSFSPADPLAAQRNQNLPIPVDTPTVPPQHQVHHQVEEEEEETEEEEEETEEEEEEEERGRRGNTPEPPSTQVTHLSPPSTQVTHLSPPSTQATHLSPPSTQVTHLSPPSTQVTHLTPPSTQVTHLSPPSTQATHLSPPSTQVTHLSPPSTQVTHLSPPSTQVTHLSPPSTQATHLSPPSTQVTHLSPPLHTGNTLDPPLHTGNTPEPPLHTGNTLEPPSTQVTHLSPPLHTSNTPEPPLHTGNTPEPPLHTGNTLSRPLHTGNTPESPLHTGNTLEPPSTQVTHLSPPSTQVTHLIPPLHTGTHLSPPLHTGLCAEEGFWPRPSSRPHPLITGSSPLSPTSPISPQDDWQVHTDSDSGKQFYFHPPPPDEPPGPPPTDPRPPHRPETLPPPLFLPPSPPPPLRAAGTSCWTRPQADSTTTTQPQGPQRGSPRSLRPPLPEEDYPEPQQDDVFTTNPQQQVVIPRAQLDLGVGSRLQELNLKRSRFQTFAPSHRRNVSDFTEVSSRRNSPDSPQPSDRNLKRNLSDRIAGPHRPHCHLLEKAGIMNKTKVVDNGKKIRKNWSQSWTVLHGGILTFHRDPKSAPPGTASKTSQITPEYTVELRGASVGWATNKSSKKNVLELKTRQG
ncbi:hypothetical protein KUCAC02_037049, partial [Chaenocephalus aceratus]